MLTNNNKFSNHQPFNGCCSNLESLSVRRPPCNLSLYSRISHQRPCASVQCQAQQPSLNRRLMFKVVHSRSTRQVQDLSQTITAVELFMLARQPLEVTPGAQLFSPRLVMDSSNTSSLISGLFLLRFRLLHVQLLRQFPQDLPHLFNSPLLSIFELSGGNNLIHTNLISSFSPTMDNRSNK